MRNRLAALTTAFLLALGIPAAASAQITIGVGGGPSIPISDLGDVADTGFHLQGSLGLQVPLLPLGGRADLLWQRFPHQQDGNVTTVGGLLNATLRMPFPIVRPYVIAGVGAMRHSAPDVVANGDDDTELAWGVGAGAQLRLIGFGGFVEARVVDWGTGNRSVPLTVGITF